MKSKVILLTFAAAALAGCSSLGTVTEVTPKRKGFDPKMNEPDAALNASLDAAEMAWHKLEKDPSNADALSAYNFAVARVCGTVRSAKLQPWKAPIQVGTRTLTWKRDLRADRSPSDFEFIPSDQLKISGKYLATRETKSGIGAPLVAKRLADQAHEYAPTPHFYHAVTAVLRIRGSRFAIEIEHPLESETIRVGDHTFPLAADYTAPLAMMLVEMHPKEQGIPRLLHPAKFADTTRLARLEPYDPDKTVVLFVHGLMSSPATWFPLLNHLRADPEIRRKYQFWLFSYPTGYPYSYSAAILRRELDAMEKRFPIRKKMVLVGHSMGGCVSRLLITDAKRKVWDSMFTVPPEKMEVVPEHKHILTESTIFTHRPEIGRVIFISSPLRGADLASSWPARLGARLVKLPVSLLTIGKEDDQYQKHAAGHQHLDRFPDSVDMLAPDNDFVVAINEIPIKSGIPHHVIAGDRGRGDAPNSSDGLVPYWSSHIKGAESEKIVPTHHNAHQSDEAIAEVERILKANAR